MSTWPRTLLKDFKDWGEREWTKLNLRSKSQSITKKEGTTTSFCLMVSGISHIIGVSNIMSSKLAEKESRISKTVQNDSKNSEGVL